MFLPKKKIKKKATRRNSCVHAHGHFCQLRKNASPLIFFSILAGLGRKYLWALPFIFLSSHSTKYIQKKFFFSFSLQRFPSILFHFQTNTPKTWVLGKTHKSWSPLFLFKIIKRKREKFILLHSWSTLYTHNVCISIYTKKISLYFKDIRIYYMMTHDEYEKSIKKNETSISRTWKNNFQNL